MPRNVYSEINLHFVWHTKDNTLILADSIERHVYSFLRDRALQTPGVFFHEIGGIEDHVHLVVSVPPTLLVSDWIGQMEGSAPTTSTIASRTAICSTGRLVTVWSASVVKTFNG